MELCICCTWQFNEAILIITLCLQRKELEDFKERMRVRREQRLLKQISAESENWPACVEKTDFSASLIEDCHTASTVFFGVKHLHNFIVLFSFVNYLLLITPSGKKLWIELYILLDLLQLKCLFFLRNTESIIIFLCLVVSHIIHLFIGWKEIENTFNRKQF